VRNALDSRLLPFFFQRLLVTLEHGVQGRGPNTVFGEFTNGAPNDIVFVFTHGSIRGHHQKHGFDDRIDTLHSGSFFRREQSRFGKHVLIARNDDTRARTRLLETITKAGHGGRAKIDHESTPLDGVGLTKKRLCYLR